MGRLPEAWIAPQKVRDQRELVRHGHKLVQMRTSLKAQVHAVLGKRGITVVDSDLSGITGRKRLAGLLHDRVTVGVRQPEWLAGS
jgi:hypothetical protein